MTSPPQFPNLNRYVGKLPPGFSLPIAFSYCSSTEMNGYYILTLTPRRETQAWDFVQANPESDGRGIVIAIFDTGVDPGAPGLMQTSDGKVKVLERYDCTGAGDVDTSTVVSAISGEEGTMFIKGLSGRNLKIPLTWKNPSGKFHIGVKAVYELYPLELLDRIKKERRKYWDDEQKRNCGHAASNLDGYQYSLDILKPEQIFVNSKLARENLSAACEVLDILDKNYLDLGPVLDCLLWRDDEDHWQICLSLGTGDGILLQEYNYSHEYSPILPTDRFNVSVNVWDDGKLLEIVGMSHTHGTHVAAIAAACFPYFPQLNGVAPGAQIVSCTIGDNRINGQETLAAIARALTRVMKCPKINIINMSYGEHSCWAPDGQIAKMMCDIVDKYGVVFVASAGNAGPCLSTIGSPAWLCDDCIIGVSAYVSSAMMMAMYSLRESIPGMTYTWSSRGPASDGGMFVNVSAPGGAITAVPNYTLMSAALMNGTSMAAPHCAGCVALLICRANKFRVPWTPYSIKRCLENTAIDIEKVDPFGQGAGLIQVPAAYKLLENLSISLDVFVRFNIRCTGGPDLLPMRGIYIRNTPLECPTEFNIFVTPVFFRDDKIATEVKIALRRHLSIICTVPWVKVPTFLELQNCEVQFAVLVDPTDLRPGVHYGRIDAVEPQGSLKGRFFSVDVTIIVPAPIIYGDFSSPPQALLGHQAYHSGELKRFFLRPPELSAWGVLNLQTLSVKIGPHDSNDRSYAANPLKTTFIIQVLTLRPGQRVSRNVWLKKDLNLNERETISFPVECGKTVEIVIGKWWSKFEVVGIAAFVKFYSLMIDKPLIGASTSEVTSMVQVSSYYGPEVVKPSAKLTHLIQLLQSTNMHIHPLRGPREEVSPGNPVYELRASFHFSVLCKTKIIIDCPILSGQLYESDYLSQLWMLFDRNKRYVGCGDSYPERFVHSVDKGDYVIRMHIRHTDIRALQKFIDTVPGGTTCFPVHLKMTLPAPINLKTFTTLSGALKDGMQIDTSQHHHESDAKDIQQPVTLRSAEVLNYYIRVLIPDKDLEQLPTTSGFYLAGKFAYSGDDVGQLYCESDLNIFIPPSDTEPATQEPQPATNVELKLDTKYKMSAYTLYEAVMEYTDLTPSRHNIDLVIKGLMEDDFYGLAAKMLLYKQKKSPETWDLDCHSKLRKCYDALEWKHVIFFADTNWMVQNPPDYRPF